MADSVETFAIVKVSAFFEKSGWAVTPVSRFGGEHSGYDLFLTKGESRLKVEVKGSSAAYSGIPDLYGTEVDTDGRLVADLLCVCYFPPGGQEKLAIIRRKDIPLGGLVRKIGYRIRSGYKNPKFIKQRLVDIDNLWTDDLVVSRSDSPVELSAVASVPFPLNELVFDVKLDEDGRLLAIGRGESIFIDGADWDDLKRNVHEGVQAFYFDRPKPKVVRLYMVRDELLVV